MKDSMISKGIHDSHERVAATYGISGIDGHEVPNSYNSWNFQRNVMEPLQSISSKHLSASTVLDAGCGNGQIAEVLINSQVNTVIGVDFSVEMLKNAQRRFNSRGLGKQFNPIQADLSSLSMIKKDSIDAALMFGVLEHLDSPALVITQILECLKPGGIFVLAVPRKYSLSHLSYLLFGDSPYRWGTPNKWWDRFRFSEKADYYRFYTNRDVEIWLKTSLESQVIEKKGFAYGHLDGLPGLVLRFLGKNVFGGHKILNFYENCLKFINFIPGGEFWIIKKSE